MANNIVAKRQIENLTFNNAKIKWRNFAGEERLPYNAKGNRNFVIELDDLAQYEALVELGWQPKLGKPREDGDEPKPFLPVTVKYGKGIPPRLKMIHSRGMVSLDAENAFALDYASIDKVDLTVRAFNWEFNGRTGVKAYLNSIYVTVLEDELERRYAAIPEVDMGGNPISAIGGTLDYQNPFEDLGEIDGPREITVGKGSDNYSGTPGERQLGGF